MSPPHTTTIAMMRNVMASGVMTTPPVGVRIVRRPGLRAVGRPATR